MRGEWAYFDKHFTKQQCDWIITEGLKLPGKKANLRSEEHTSELQSH